VRPDESFRKDQKVCVPLRRIQLFHGIPKLMKVIIGNISVPELFRRARRIPNRQEPTFTNRQRDKDGELHHWIDVGRC
jgi:hypothetical protein